MDFEQTQKPPADKIPFINRWYLIWRRGWDSNPRGLASKLISSQPRYDHFDTSPYSIYVIGTPEIL